jgi:hypothetical protein
MKAIHAILNAAKVILGLTGNKPAALAVGAADVALTTVETIVAQTKTHGADGATTVFLTSPDMDAQLFRQYTQVIRAAFIRDTTATGIALPRVVMLPPGMTMEVVKETADQLLHAAAYINDMEAKKA